jgi:hypothetical protein
MILFSPWGGGVSVNGLILVCGIAFLFINVGDGFDCNGWGDTINVELIIF